MENNVIQPYQNQSVLEWAGTCWFPHGPFQQHGVGWWFHFMGAGSRLEESHYVCARQQASQNPTGMAKRHSQTFVDNQFDQFKLIGLVQNHLTPFPNSIITGSSLVVQANAVAGSRHQYGSWVLIAAKRRGYRLGNHNLAPGAQTITKGKQSLWLQTCYLREGRVPKKDTLAWKTIGESWCGIAWGGVSWCGTLFMIWIFSMWDSMLTCACYFHDLEFHDLKFYYVVVSWKHIFMIWSFCIWDFIVYIEKNLRFQYVVVSWNRISWPGVLFTWDFIRSGFMIWSFDQLRFHEIGLISWSRVLCNRAFMESDFMIWCCF